MCTTYLAAVIIDKLAENGYNIHGLPRLIRLNPFARFKTRGNGAVHIKISTDNLKTTDLEKIEEIVLSNLEKLSVFSCENTNPGVIFYQGEIDNEWIEYSLKAIHSIITISEAEEFANKKGAKFYKYDKGRGIIGSLAAIGTQLNDKTYELLAYRIKENYGTKRQIVPESVHQMDKETYPDTFENIDGDYLAIEPHTGCPVLYGVRGESSQILEKAYKIIQVKEPIERHQIFLTNQHTDMHLQKADKITDMEQYSSYIIQGKVKNYPRVIEGGHIFFTLQDHTGEIEAAAYEPTKDFRKIVKKLVPGDIVQLYGGIGEQKTFNIEKFKLEKIAPEYKYENPICECGKRMKSAGSNKGFKCPRCGNKLRDNQKIKTQIPREIKEEFYESPISARRHLSKPLIRYRIQGGKLI